MNMVYNFANDRCCIKVQGIVQGVGFRPFIYGLALRYNLTGFVLNDSTGVIIEVEGLRKSLRVFIRSFTEELPPLARVDTVTVEQIPIIGSNDFIIKNSQDGVERFALVSSDSATCDDCLHELFDSTNRRYRYPFINCTNCGPRFTIVQDVPYDREKTTMQPFLMCSECQQEYSNPMDRRFHAQPNACSLCGPQVSFVDWSRSINYNSGVSESDPIVSAGKLLAQGFVLAVKGLGGYHLACDAFNVKAVQSLRRKKSRDAKPFALMVSDVETARMLCKMSDAEIELLQSRRRPIVLLERRGDCNVADDVAPNCNTLGLVLAYTPLHYLLLDAFAHQISPNRPAVLVMTSANMSDEPIIYKDGDFGDKLESISDGMLTHNRDIHIRCDDTVMRVSSFGTQFFRRSRGYVPEPIDLLSELRSPILACGGELKNTFCLAKGRQAFVSHHIGNLHNLKTFESFTEGIQHYQRLLDIYPKAIVHDLHPEYSTTKFALGMDIPWKFGVQHHHAHIASVLAEHRLEGPVIGIAADGTGFGTDDTIWGCEVLLADLSDFKRLAHLRYIPLIGGEMAILQPWRVTAAYLEQIYGREFLNLEIPFVEQLDTTKWRILSVIAAKRINSPMTSSLGRLFDAISALLMVRTEVQYEGQAAIELEAMAMRELSGASLLGISPYKFDLRHDASAGNEGILLPTQLDVEPMIREIIDDIQRGENPSHIATKFHRTIVELLTEACVEARRHTGLDEVALSGGVFQNKLLLESLISRLREMHFTVYTNQLVPPNDGGLSLGQLAIAAKLMEKL